MPKAAVVLLLACWTGVHACCLGECREKIVVQNKAGLAECRRKYQQEKHKDDRREQEKRGARVAKAAGVGAAAGAGAAAAVPAVVGSFLGITCTGPVAGGIFASLQAAAGGAAGSGLAAGGLLSAAQALVMGGIGGPVVVGAAMAGSLAFGLAAALCHDAT